MSQGTYRLVITLLLALLLSLSSVPVAAAPATPGESALFPSWSDWLSWLGPRTASQDADTAGPGLATPGTPAAIPTTPTVQVWTDSTPDTDGNTEAHPLVDPNG